MKKYKKIRNSFGEIAKSNIAYPGPGLFRYLLRAHVPSTRANAMPSVASTRTKHQPCAIIRDTHTTCGLDHV
jgi:hypothetical protein